MNYLSVAASSMIPLQFVSCIYAAHSVMVSIRLGARDCCVLDANNLIVNRPLVALTKQSLMCNAALGIRQNILMQEKV